MGYSIGLVSREAREDTSCIILLHVITINYCKFYAEESSLLSQIELTLGYHLHLLGTAVREEEVHLFLED